MQEIESNLPTGLEECCDQEELIVIKENLTRKKTKKSVLNYVTQKVYREAGKRSARQSAEEIIKNMTKDEQNEVFKGTPGSPKLEKELTEIFNTPQFEETTKANVKQILKNVKKRKKKC